MRTAIALLPLLAACGAHLAAPPADDAGTPPTLADSGELAADAGTPAADSGESTRVDAYMAPEQDAGMFLADSGPPEPAPDAGTIEMDSGFAPDAGQEYLPDSAQPDAGPPAEDGGPPAEPDAGPPPPPADAGPPPCEPDGLEPNDSRDEATPIATMVDPSEELAFDLTWHAGDAADWASLEARRGLNTIRVTAYDSDPGSRVTVRVRCLSGLVWCRGVGSGRPQPDTCEATGAVGVSRVDVACYGDGAADAWVGVSPPAVLDRCGHRLRIVAEPVP